METTVELITPEYAKKILSNNSNNRKIKQSSVNAIANDIKGKRWVEGTGVPICIDTNGRLVDGQHRLYAIVESGTPIYLSVCRGVNPNSVYDMNDKRNPSDHMHIINPNIENVYKDSRTLSVVKFLIFKGYNRKKLSILTYSDYVEKHKKELDGFFLVFPKRKAPKIRNATVILSLYLAYINGISMDEINRFYDVLSTGMSEGRRDYPIIAYRNYLLNIKGEIHPSSDEVSRCQYALDKYLTNSCTKKNIASKVIWDFI